jgi:hypothetical protein
MRSRTAVLAGALAILAIAAVPMARAESQTTITQRELSSDGGHASYDLDSLIALQVQVPQAAEIRIFKADSAGRKLLVLQVPRSAESGGLSVNPIRARLPFERPAGLQGHPIYRQLCRAIESASRHFAH